MNPKLHFVSLVCVDYDMDLMPHWFVHYLRYRYDTYTVYLHTRKVRDKSEMENIRAYFNSHGFNAVWVGGEFKDGNLRQELLHSHHMSTDPGDYIIAADSDEFQEFEHETAREVICAHDCIEGYLVDCWGDSLVDAVPGIPLATQYPNEGNYKEASGTEGAVHPNRRKILAARRDLDVNYIGSHCIEVPRDERGIKIFSHPSRKRVLHYTFRASLPERMSGKGYFHSKDLLTMLEYFGLSWHPVLDRVLAEEDKIQEQMGWIPVSRRITLEERAKAVTHD